MSQAEAIIEGDVGSIAGARSVADQANRLGHFDAVIHNVGIGYREPRRNETKAATRYVGGLAARPLLFLRRHLSDRMFDRLIMAGFKGGRSVEQIGDALQ